MHVTVKIIGIYPVIIQDIKSQSDEGCNAWGHLNGGCMIEFEVLRSMRWSLYHGSGSWISELINRPIYKVINIGSIYSGNDYYFKNIKQACIDYGLSGYYLLTSPYGGEYVWNFKDLVYITEPRWGYIHQEEL